MSENELFRAALSKAMAMCSRRELSASDIRQKLDSWGISTEDAEKIIVVLSKENFINEFRFASAFARDRFRYGKWGKLKIASHLRLKKIEAGTIDAALKEIDDEEYIDTLKNLLARHGKTIRAKSPYELKSKLIRYGLSKGFESSLLYELIGESEQ